MRSASSRMRAALTPKSEMLTTTVCTTSAIAKTPNSFGATIRATATPSAKLPTRLMMTSRVLHAAPRPTRRLSGERSLVTGAADWTLRRLRSCPVHQRRRRSQRRSRSGPRRLRSAPSRQERARRASGRATRQPPHARAGPRPAKHAAATEARRSGRIRGRRPAGTQSRPGRWTVPSIASSPG